MDHPCTQYTLEKWDRWALLKIEVHLIISIYSRMDIPIKPYRSCDEYTFESRPAMDVRDLHQLKDTMHELQFQLKNTQNKLDELDRVSIASLVDEDYDRYKPSLMDRLRNRKCTIL